MPELYGPRGAYTRPQSNLARARGLVQAEQLQRTRTGGSLFGMRFRSGADISRAAENYPVGYARAHGGRGVAEVRRDRFLNTLQRRRGMEPTAPAYRPSLGQRMRTWGAGAVQRAGERSFWDIRRSTPGGYR